MAIRAAGTYVSKNKGAKASKRKLKGKESRFNKNKFFNLTSSKLFPVSNHGQTSHPKMRSKQDVKQFLIGRTFSVNQGDLESKDSKNAISGSFRNFNFKVTSTIGNDCQSVFNGLKVNNDCIAGIIKKWHTLIETQKSFLTKDGSSWRIFINTVTKKRTDSSINQLSSSSSKSKSKSSSLRHYAKLSEVKKIRKIVFEVIEEMCEGIETDKLVKLLSGDLINRTIEKKCEEIYPVNTLVYKVKPIKNMGFIQKVNASKVSATKNSKSFVQEEVAVVSTFEDNKE